MAGALVFTRFWKANHMASKVPKRLSSVAITIGHTVGISLGYCSLTAIQTSSKAISAPGAKTRSVPVSADTTTRTLGPKSQKGGPLGTPKE